MTGIRRFDGPEQLKKIGPSLFANSKVETVVLPKAIDALPPLLFFNCRSLEAVVLKNSEALTSSDSAFAQANRSLSIYKMNPAQLTGVSEFKVSDEQPPAVLEQASEKYERAPMQWRSIKEAIVPDQRLPIAEWPPKEGSFAIVYKVQHTVTKEISAVKELKTMSEPEFVGEIEALDRVVHPGIIGLIGVVWPVSTTQRGKIITEFMPNGSLDELLKRPDYAKLSATVKVKIVVGVVLAMRYIHSRKLVHRDLKPRNILLDENLEPRVADFGSARSLDMTLTLSGALGTPYYMPPELFEERPRYGEATDVYSFSITLWEVLVGRLMSQQFPGTQYPVIKFSNGVKNGMRPPTSEPDIELEEWVVKLLEQCWASGPETRLLFNEILEEFRLHKFALLRDVDAAAVEEYISKIMEFEETQSPI
jgi:hypothetical protein